MHDFPTSIQGLRRACKNIIEEHPRTVWNKFETFFLEHGYTLWVAHPTELATVVPADSRERAPDGFIYQWAEDTRHPPSFPLLRPVFCPARSIDGRDVLIRVITIGQDGVNHKLALERLATGNIASVIGNHCTPVLQWLSLEDVTFAVFPMLGSDPVATDDFENVGDMLATTVQLFEAVAFCHERLVAHRDLFLGNFLGNFTGSGPDQFMSGRPQTPARPFRSLFPFRVFLIDFELAVCFEPGSAPGSHVVVGLPTGDLETYDRPIVPEMMTGEPHSPFLADVWQLGHYVWDIPVQDFPAPVTSLLRRMMHSDASERPSAEAALRELRQIISSMSKEELKGDLIYIFPGTRPYHV